MILIILVSILAGISIVVARNINASLANEIGLIQGTFYNYITGLFTSLIFILFSGEFLRLHVSYFKELPLWAYLGGLVGIMVVACSSIVTPKVPAFYLSLLMFIGQLFSGILVDYFNGDTVSIGKFLGGILILSGLSYNLYIDKKFEVVEAPEQSN